MKKIICVVLSFVLMTSIFAAFSFAAETTRIIAGSDFQNPDGNSAGKAVADEIIGAMLADGITSADGFFFCGDYDHDLTMLPTPTSKGVNAVKNSVKKLVGENGHYVFIQGNHDSPIGTGGLSESGNNDPESGKYGVFVINEDDYMWMNISSSIIKNTANNLKLYLNEKLAEGFKAPIFVLSHLPLHYNRRSEIAGDGTYSQYIFDVLNEGGAKGLNIFFLYGHDHASGWDDYLGGAAVCLEKGDSINISKLGNRFAYQTKTLNFTYLNAGFTGYYDNHNGADDSLTMTCYDITENEVIIRRYDKNGLHNVKSSGIRNEYKHEKDYEPNQEVKTSPLTVTLTEVSDTTPIANTGVSKLVEIIASLIAMLQNLLKAVC